ncbi:MAG: hypothetical protein JRH20_27155 [Deltaproteobacteria bacterium]|nr:hypothetical protein [Deltaproteobacteria bacterium]
MYRKSLLTPFAILPFALVAMLGCSESSTPTPDGGSDSSGQACTPEAYRECTSSLPGVCAPGGQRCLASGSWSPCEPTILPGTQSESCTNQADDDCDGFTDEADMDCVACTVDDARDCTAIAPGICAEGQQVCSSEHTWGVCGPKIRPGSVQENCANNLDDDCDGKTDADDSDCEACTPDLTRDCNSGHPGVCAEGTQTCGANKLWGACAATVEPAERTEDCTNHQDDDCDGFTDATDTDCCEDGATQECDASNAFCIGEQTCANNTWGSCVLKISSEEDPDKGCDGVDDDCDGVADNGATFKGPTLLVEYLPASVTKRLIGHDGETFLYGRIGSAGRWAIWDAWTVDPIPARMLDIGENLEVLLNKLTTSGTYFTTSDLSNASALMIGVPDFPDSSCSGEGCLMVIVGSRVKMVNLGTGATKTIDLSAFPWGDPPATTPPTSLSAATSFPKNSFIAADGSDTDPVVLLIDGNRCWFWSPNGNPLTETTTTNCFCHASGSDQSCPANDVLENLDAISYFRGGDGSHNVGLSQGQMHYASPMLEATSEWAISYAWGEIPISAYACDHTPR